MCKEWCDVHACHNVIPIQMTLPDLACTLQHIVILLQRVPAKQVILGLTTAKWHMLSK